MGSLYLVRHGQASFGTDNYDKLSDLGHDQCHALGAYFSERGVSLDAVFRGSLVRHEESLAAFERGFGQLAVKPEVCSELNEYDSEALLTALGGEPLPPAQSPEGFKAHFRRLRQALHAWMEGRISPEGMPAFADFRAGITRVMERVNQLPLGSQVLIVSSGGPISTAVGSVLGASPASTIDLNMRMRNSSLTEFVFNPRGQQLVQFNAVPHLELPMRRHWITHA